MIFRSFVEIFQLLYIITKQIFNSLFWQQELDQIITTGCFILVGCIVSWLLMQMENVTINVARRGGILILLSFISRLAFNVRKNVDYLADCKGSFYGMSTKLYSLYRHHCLEIKWQCGLIDREQNIEMQKEYVVYEGQVQNHISNCNLVNCPCHVIYQNQLLLEESPDDPKIKEMCRKTSGKNRLKLIQIFMMNRQSKQSQLWKSMLLKMQLFWFFEFLTTFRRDLARYYKNSTTVIDRYEIYHLTCLYEANLNSYYMEKVNGEDINGNTNFEDTYWTAYLCSLKTPKEKLLDINVAFEGQAKFNEVTDMCEDIIQMDIDLTNYLKNFKLIDLNSLKHYNRRLMEKDKAQLDYYKKYANMITKYPTFFYPPLILYYSWIRNFYTVRTKIYEEYMMRLKMYEYNVGNQQKLTRTNFLQEAVIIQCSLENDKSGTILKITPDYFQYLGYLPDGISPVGTNINLLLPGIIQDIHMDAMKNKMNHFYRFLNYNRDFVIKKYSGYLADTQFIVKFQTILSTSLSAVVQLRLKDVKKKDDLIVMLDDDLRFHLTNYNFYNMISNNLNISQNDPSCFSTYGLSRKFHHDLVLYLNMYRAQINKNENLWMITEFQDQLLDSYEIARHNIKEKDAKPVVVQTEEQVSLNPARKSEPVNCMNTTMKTVEKKKRMEHLLESNFKGYLDILDIQELSDQNNGKHYIIDPNSFLFKSHGGHHFRMSQSIQPFLNSKLCIVLRFSVINLSVNDEMKLLDKGHYLIETLIAAQKVILFAIINYREM